MGETKIITAESGKELIVTRTFDAPLSKVWHAWTNATELDKWWAPKPWKAVTKEFDFFEGGHWLYAMQGPEGDKQWCIVRYHAIEEGKSFSSSDAFSDDEGNVDDSMPVMQWHNTFEDQGGKTLYTATLTFETEEALNKIVAMGFKEGFTMGLDNLDGIL
jgi:uncharacterized protein YndB with AHSA1/START domain